MKWSHSVEETIHISVPFYLNLRKQNIKCPLCTFKSKHVKSPRSFITHFSRHIGQYSLDIAYTCTMCTDTMQADQHLQSHQRERIPLTPTIIAPADSPLSPEESPASTPTSSTQTSPSSRETSPSPDEDHRPGTSPQTSCADVAPECPDEAVQRPTELTFPSSPPLPDSQNSFSPLQPSPPRLSPEESDAIIMRRFLDACKESPEAQKNISLSNLPLGETSISDCPGTPLTTNLLPLNPLLQRPTQTPNRSTPPSLANTTASPDLHLPSTRKPSQIVHRRPTAADVFERPMVDLPPDDAPQSTPPRPPSNPATRCHSPLGDGPAPQSFPSSDQATTREAFRQKFLLQFDNELAPLKIYHHCFTAQDVPSAWKQATTILIHKKESTSDPSNFRPIALMSCLYKLLMAVLARRMTTFAIDKDLLSKEQKSARASEGCYEHAFILESVLNDARRQLRPLCLAWLDIRNAFGSIPHAALSTTLSHMGFPPQLISMIMNVCTGATTEVLTPTGKTLPIPIHSGVKQGCPLSAILFNMAIELIICKCIASAAQSTRRSLKHHGLSLSILAYADDIVLLARDKRSLQHLLDAVSEAANSLNLEFRPDKCASLCLNKTAPRIQREEFLVQDRPIPALAKEDHYRYLGVPIGLIPNISEISTLVDVLTDKLKRINQSLLCPWQKLDAIRTFVHAPMCMTKNKNTRKNRHECFGPR